MGSIRAKMLLWFGLTLGSLMVVFGLITYTSIKQTVLPLTRDLALEVLTARSAEMGRLIQGYLREVRAVAERDPMTMGDFERIARDLAERAPGLNPDFEILLFADRQGRYTTSKGFTGSIADRDYWQAIMVQGRDEAISAPLVSRSTGAPMVAMARVVTDRQGTRIGLAAVTVPLSNLSRIAECIHIGRSGAGWVVDGTGLVIAHPDPALPMRLNLLDSASADYQELEAMGQRIVRGESGQGSFVRPDGVRIVTLYTPIPHTPGWSFCISLESSELMERPEQLMRRVAWLLAAMLAVVLLVVLLLSRMISAPVRQLQQGVDRAGGGDLDAVLDIRTNDEIQALAEAFNRMQLDLKDHIRKLTETTAIKERIEGELQVATDIQVGLLPRIFPAFPDREEFDIHASMVPAKEVGGDFYDFFFVDERHLCFLVADVADKGVPAALYMMVAKTLLKAEGQRLGEPDWMLTSVNTVLAADNDSCMFITVFCAILDTESGEVRFANAGHNPPLLISAGKARLLPVRPGIVLGPMADAVYATERMVLQPGEVLFLYTDGITEAMNRSGELFGEQRLQQTLEDAAQCNLEEMLVTVRNRVLGHADGVPQSDDITMMAIKYRGSGADGC